MAVIESGAVTVEEGVAYGRGGDRELLCDIYRPSPEVAAKRTAILNLPGGGFRRCNRASTRVARPLAALGYTCVSAEYRVLPDGIWPAPLHDVKAALRWTRAQAHELGFEPDKLVVLGHSAGGRLALMLAGTQDDPTFEGASGSADVGTAVAACISFYSPAGDMAQHPVAGPNPSEAQLRSMSLTDRIKPGYPPTVLLHGTDDKTFPVEHALTLYSAPRAAGAPVELHVLEGMTHIFDAHEDLARASADWVDLFVDRHVANPRTYPSTEPPAL
jgi:acetyl esterase/lipase